MPRTHQMVRRRLASGIRTVRFVGIGFGKGRRIWAQGTGDLISGYVQETESFTLGSRQRSPVTANGIQQTEAAHHVGLNELARAVDGTIYV